MQVPTEDGLLLWLATGSLSDVRCWKHASFLEGPQVKTMQNFICCGNWCLLF